MSAFQEGDQVVLKRDCGDHKQGQCGVVIRVNDTEPPTLDVVWAGHKRPDKEWQFHWFEN